MKRNVLIGIIIALMIAMLGFYVWEIVMDEVPPSENLLTLLAVEFSLAATLTRLFKRESRGRKSLTFYERSYTREIGRAFESNEKSKKQLLTAIRFYNENNFDRAIPILKGLRRECRNTRDKQVVMLFAALCYSDSNQTELAMEEYEQLLTENGEHRTALGNLALLYTKVGKYQKAEELYEKAIRLDPEEGIGYYNLASLYYRMGECGRATALAETALDKKQNLYQASSLLSILHALSGDMKTSQHHFERAVANGENAANLRTTIENRLAEQREITRYESELANREQSFDGDIIITDPTYIVRSNEDWEACGYGKNLSVLGIRTYITFAHGDCVGTDVINSDTDEQLGEFCSDSCMVSIISLSELLAYEPTVLDKLEKHCYTIIRDFHGVVRAKAEPGDEDQYWKFIGDGNIHFESGLV